MFRKWSLKQKMILTYVLLALVTILINSGFAVFSIRRNNTERNRAAYINAAELISSGAVNALSNYGNYAFLMAQNTSLVNMLTYPLPTYDKVFLLNTAVEPNIYFFITSYSAIQSVTIYTDMEKQSIPSKLFADSRSVSSSQWYETASDMYGAYWHYEDNRLFVSNRIQSFNTTATIGMVQIEMDCSQLFDVLNTPGSKIHTAVIDTKSGSLLFPSGLSQEAMAFIQNPDNDSRYFLLNQTDLPGTALRLLSYTESESIFSQTFLELLPVLTIIVLSCVIAGILIGVFYASFSQRMDVVIQAINQMDEKNFSIHLPEVGKDELSSLSACLNTMSGKIQELFQEISRTKDMEKAAELEALQAKINPHFLYNILDTINWYALDSENTAICRLINHLAAYYRTNLNEGKSTATVSHELQNIDAYINLHLLMNDRRFDVDYDLDDDLLNCEICNFILQPLVENAIIHGVNKLIDRPGRIRIELKREEDNLLLSVCDNGYGMTEDAIATVLDHQGRAYGINNVQQRIHLHYGPFYGLSISSRLGEGTRVTITLPIRYSADAPHEGTLFNPQKQD